MKEEGRENIFIRHQKMRELITRAFIHWGQSGPLELAVSDENHRSNAVTTFFAKEYDLGPLRAWLEKHLGLTVGVSLGFDNEEFLNGNSVARIGHMGHTNPHMILGVISCLEVAFKVFKIPHQASAIDQLHDIFQK